ncbi:MAG: Flp family type IVb pilin [Candidatus Njordarchaeota archaeon]
MIEKIRDKIARFIKDNRASPLVEEGLLIGLAIILFIVIVTVIDQIINWINNLAGELPS